MKIAVNTRFLLKDRLEGIGTYTHEICRRMVRDHPESEFHFFFDRTYDETFIYGSNVVPHILRPPARHPLLWYWWFEYLVPRTLKKTGAQVFFSPDMFLSLSTKVPTLMTSHDLAYLHYPDHIKKSHLKYFRKYFPEYHRKAQKITCVSRSTFLDVIKQYGIEEQKMFVAPNACKDGFKQKSLADQNGFREKLTDGRPYLLYLGAIHPRKNILTLVKAFESYKFLHNDNLVLVLAGRWAWHTKELQEYIRMSKISSSIMRIERPDAIIYDLMASAEIFIYPSLFEGFGIPILEAMKSGVPVITSSVSSMPEVAGDAAVFINPLRSSEICNAVHSIRTDDDKKKQLIDKGIRRSRQFSWQESSERIYDHLMQMTIQ